MKTTINSYFRFLVLEAMVTNEPPITEELSEQDAIDLVKRVICIALQKDESEVQVERLENYPHCCKMPLLISVDGGDDQLFWFYPQQPFAKMCAALRDMLEDLSASCCAVPA